jgi:hypothetical protein
MLYFNAPSEIRQNRISPFTYQHFFETSAFYILEVTSNNPSIENFSSNNQWLMIDKNSFLVSPLHIRFTDSSSVVEERYFEEGYLKFNHTSGTYIEKYNSAQHSLVQIPAIAIPSAAHQAVADFII